MSSSMKARQKFLEQKFDGNRRLAQEFVYIQDPSVTQLQKWQVWKKEAEAEDRWTSWQTEDRAKTAIRKEPFRDPFLTRRKKRHRHRVATKGPYDVEREVGLVESTESLAWEVKVKQDKIAAMLKGLPPPPLPPAPAKLLAFAVTEKVVKKLHSLEPPDHQYYDPDDESVIINQPGSSKKKKKDKKKKKKEVSQSHKKVGDYRKREEESLSPSNLVYRFRLWWNGYYAATNCQRIVRGYLARQWVSLRIYEVRALIRRRAVYKVQRLYRGYRGRVAYRLHFIKLTSAALFIQRAYRRCVCIALFVSFRGLVLGGLVLVLSQIKPYISSALVSFISSSTFSGLLYISLCVFYIVGLSLGLVPFACVVIGLLPRSRGVGTS